jgi:hypothetical protein
MRHSTSGPAPDDDPRFAEWVANTEPMPDLPELPDDVDDIPLPLTAAITLLAGAAGIVVALGWAALGFAINTNTWTAGAATLMVVGTLLVITGGAFAYLGHRRPQ